nr:hypothetical protein [Tanacetum cinerariifolium]
SLVDKILCDLDKAPDSPHLHTFSSNQRHCFHCKDVLGDGEICQRCTYMRCGSGLSKGLCLICKHNQNSINDSPSISENSSQSPPYINHNCCYECGDPLEGIFCRQCTCKSCGNDAHYGYNCPPKVPILPNPKPFHNQTIKELPPTVPSFGSKSDLVHDYPNVFDQPPQLPLISCEFCGNDARYGHYCTPQIPACYDDYDDDYALAITPNKPDYSLSMGEEHLDTILATESDEFINSSVDNLVPILSESVGESECDVPAHEEFTTFSNILFDADYESDSNQHHDNVESDLIESQRTHDSLLIISSKIDSLLDEFTDELALLKSIPPGIDETDCDFKEDIRLIEKLLYDNSSPRPPEEFVSANSDAEIESFSPSPIPVEDSDSLMEEIDLSFNPVYPMPPGIKEDDYDSKRDILILKDLPSNDALSLPENESFHFDIPSFPHPPTKPPDGDIRILNVKMMGDTGSKRRCIRAPKCVSSSIIPLESLNGSGQCVPLNTCLNVAGQQTLAPDVGGSKRKCSHRLGNLNEDSQNVEAQQTFASNVGGLKRKCSHGLGTSMKMARVYLWIKMLIYLADKYVLRMLVVRNGDYCCSEGSLRDRIICDLNKTPDLFQEPPQNCPKCGNLVDGQYGQGCALLQKKFKQDLFTYCIEKGILQDLQDASKPSNDNTNVVNALQEPFVVKQDPGKSFSQSTLQINHHCCYGCGDPLEYIFCHQCTCELCGKGAHYGYNCPPKVSIIPNLESFNNQTVDELPQTLPSFDPTCYYGDGNSFTYDSKSNIVDDSHNVFNPPPQTPTYSYEFYGNDAYYGHDCSLQVSFTYNPEPCYNQDFIISQNFQIFHQQYLCCTCCGSPHETCQCDQLIFDEPYCENCEGPHMSFQCQPTNQNHYEPNPCYDSNSFGFNQFQPPRFSVIHQPIREKTCAELLAEEQEADINTQPFPYSVVPQPPQEEISVLSLAWETILEIELAFEDKHCQPEDILELFQRLHNDVQNIHEELAVYINTPSWDCPTICYNDDDDEDYTIAITLKEPDNSESMGDEHLDIIPATKSDEFIKSSVENLVPNLSESEGEHECDVPACEDFTTFSNLLFDADYDFSSSDDQSFYDEDIPKEIYLNPLFDEEIISMKIDPHHLNAKSDLIESLLNLDSPIISSSSKIDSLFNEFVGELTILKSIPLGINETDCDSEEETRLIKRLLYDNSFPLPPEEFISGNFDTAIESFSPFSILAEDSDSFMEEIDLSFTPDDPMSPGIEEDDYDSKRDILILKELLSSDSLSLPKNESFHFDIPSSSRPPAKPPNGNSGILNVKVMGDISEHKVPMSRLMLTQPPRVPNQEKSSKLLHYLGREASQPSTECPMMIYGRNTPILDVPFLHLYPL